MEDVQLKGPHFRGKKEFFGQLESHKSKGHGADQTMSETGYKRKKSMLFREEEIGS
jgi:hypothetical protein